MIMVCLFILFSNQLFSQMPLAEERSVQLSATVETSPPTINLTWKSDPGASKYEVFRKPLDADSWGTPIANLPGTATSYTDINVEVGVGYEYAFFKEDFAPRIDTICVPSGTEVKFTINDMFGIGLCCSFGIGSYEVKNCGLVFAEGDDFGMTDSHTFITCVDGAGCSEVIVTLNTDMFENSTSWVLTDNLTGAVLGSSGAVGSFVKPRPEYGFIYAGIELPAIEERGKILLLVENSLATPLATEIEELELDYIKDGWQVITEEVDATDSPSSIRTMIQNLYATENDLNAVFLLGHIPIPYSGDIFPDTHFELRGAYPADVFYGEMDGIWTDQIVENTTANFDIYFNTVGDGRFDQSSIPTGEVELQVGRVDFFDMPAFASTNQDLIQQYLNKNHSFKTRQINPIRRAIIDDNFNQSFAAPAASGFRNFSTMFGSDNIIEADYFTTLENESYLWSYGCGGGSIVSSQGIGSTNDFVTSNLQSVFTMLFGSQFGNWAYPDNFLRAPLASGQTLTNVWAGNPPWTLHHMAMGYNIGYSTLKTQNGNSGLYLGNGSQLVHVALMGDPTLRMHMVEPPSNITFTNNPASIDLTWNAPIDENVFGYHIYRSETLNGKFERINSNVITTTSYTDTNPNNGENWYMVKTVKLEESASGTYFNLSLGEINNTDFTFMTVAAASFNSNSQEGCVGNVVQYNNTSTGNISTYNWTFEGGTPATSNLENPEVVYNSIGTYDVSLTVTDPFVSSTDSQTDFIIIDDIPSADFNFTIDNGTIEIIDNTTNADFYFWDFGNGDSSQTVGDVSYTYTTTGTFTITLIASNQCGPAQISETVNITITSLERIDLAKLITVFPNPTDDFLMIDFGEALNSNVRIELINSLGKIIRQQDFDNPSEVEQINLSNISAGIYFIKIKNEELETYKRIVIQ